MFRKLDLFSISGEEVGNIYYIGAVRKSSQAADFFDTGIQKLIPLYKCLSSGSGHVEK
jgi:hypothetical protein